MSTFLALLANVFILAFVSGVTTSVCPIESMADVSLLSRLSALLRIEFVSITLRLSSNAVGRHDGFIVTRELGSICKQDVLPLSNFVPDGFIVLEQFRVAND